VYDSIECEQPAKFLIGRGRPSVRKQPAGVIQRRNISKRSSVRKALLAERGAGKTALPPSLAQEDAVKNVHEVLRQKEQQLVTMQKEVDALRIVAPLLEDEVKAPAPISQQLHQANTKKGVLP
jgi:hypothetical protein